MFQFSGLASGSYVFTARYIDITLYGFSHSEIRGSQTASVYSRLIAGNHVLHRLLVPRHPPYALGNFTKESLLIHKPMIQVVVRLDISRRQAYHGASLQCLMIDKQ
jgi:hypothetical protein